MPVRAAGARWPERRGHAIPKHTRTADQRAATHLTRSLPLLGSALIATFALLTMYAGSDPTRVLSAEVFHIPAGQGTVWEILAGYNTATHIDTDPHAIDVWRVDAETGGSVVRAPVSGRVRYLSDDCMSLRDGNDNNILLCHMFPDANLYEGQQVAQGERLGVVAPDGFANNNGIAHIHISVHVTSDNGWGNGGTIPFTGQYAIEGIALPATSTSNAYYGQVFTSQNTSVATGTGESSGGTDGSGGTGGSSGGDTGPGGDAGGSATDDDPEAGELAVWAGEDRTVAPGALVTLTAEGHGPGGVPLTYSWGQLDGPPVPFSITGKSVKFTAPTEPGTVLVFRALVLTPTLDHTSDAVVVTVDGEAASPSADDSEAESELESAAAPAEGLQGAAPPPEGVGVIVSGELPAAGFGLIVYGGGSSGGLVAASGCPLESARFWAVHDGSFVGYFPGTALSAPNTEWEALFAAGIPQNTPLMGSCR